VTAAGGRLTTRARAKSDRETRETRWLSDKPTWSATFVRLAQHHDSGVNHFGRGGPALAAWAVFTRSAKTAIVRFVQPVWFVRQPPSYAGLGINAGRFPARRSFQHQLHRLPTWSVNLPE
jgi:hypothetical protein